MKRLRDSHTFFKQLAKAKRKDRIKAIMDCDRKHVIGICELSKNICAGCVKLTPAQRKRLLKHKKVVKDLAKTRSVSVARQKILQKGGGFFLPALLAPVIGALVSKFIG
ncbi:hypothetical protein L596_021155 [Steinernema carpocapsae]|nr:hypothetical protein L596_021155 [Steinernema carpocapsae]